MKYNFKRFEKTHSRYIDKITITKSEYFGFPSHFYNLNNLSKYSHVVLFYDKDQKAIGIHFTKDPSQKGVLSMIKSKKGYGANVVARSFFSANRIEAKNIAGKYEYKKEKLEDGTLLYVIELKGQQES